MKKTFILVTGSIATGKTSLLDLLMDKFGILKEPVEFWQTGFPDDMLNLMYSDPERWSFTFQMMAFGTRAKTWKEVEEQTPHKCVLMERSVYDDREVFARLALDLGHMTPTEYEIYCMMWDFVVEQWVIKPDLILYLRTPADECLRRIAKRGRLEEEGITLEFLEEIERRYDGWLLGRNDVIVLDGYLPTAELTAGVAKLLGSLTEVTK